MSNIQILLLLLVAFGLPTLLVLGILFFKNISQIKLYKRFSNAIAAQAQVLSIENSMVLRDVRGKLKVSLSLKVHLPNNDAYTANATWEIDLTAIAAIQPGQVVAVKVDTDEKNIIYPNVSWATYWI
ncbi:MAG: hypothetical protein K9H63_02665 [Sphingobacteriaceae bacterium]|nr:hypothetical protein [Sphingobacteriaceae bacterium]